MHSYFCYDVLNYTIYRHIESTRKHQLIVMILITSTAYNETLLLDLDSLPQYLTMLIAPQFTVVSDVFRMLDF